MANEDMIISGDENQSLPIAETEFISEVQTELTVACSLPFTIPKKEILRIIKYAAKWFYKNYEDAVEERYGIILNDTLRTEEFNSTRTITLPSCIVSVFKVQKTNGEGSFSGAIRSMPDFTLEKLIFQNFRETSSISENMMMTVLYQYWADLAQPLVLFPVTYNYNRYTNKLWIGGKIPDGDLVLNLYKEVPVEYLYKDETFFDYVVAKAKTELSRILGTFQFNLVGNVTINYDLFKSEGEEKIQSIIDTIKSEEGTDWFFTSGSQ